MDMDNILQREYWIALVESIRSWIVREILVWQTLANLFSGLILLPDRSIKPGDVIAIDDTYGQIRSMGARYVSIVTRDSTEYLVPTKT